MGDIIFKPQGPRRARKKKDRTPYWAESKSSYSGVPGAPGFGRWSLLSPSPTLTPPAGLRPDTLASSPDSDAAFLWDLGRGILCPSFHPQNVDENTVLPNTILSLPGKVMELILGEWLLPPSPSDGTEKQRCPWEGEKFREHWVFLMLAVHFLPSGMCTPICLW